MTDPIAVMLQLAFLGVLYLFLLWVARSTLKDLRRPPASAMALPPHPSSASRPVLVAEEGGGLRAGSSFQVDSSTTIGRSPQTEIQISDPFASARHARVFEYEGAIYLEDMGSTNGTYLNGHRVAESEPLQPADRIRIGGTQFRYDQ